MLDSKWIKAKLIFGLNNEKVRITKWQFDFSDFVINYIDYI